MADRTTYKGFPVFTTPAGGTGGDFVDDISRTAADRVEPLETAINAASTSGFPGNVLVKYNSGGNLKTRDKVIFNSADQSDDPDEYIERTGHGLKFYSTGAINLEIDGTGSIVSYESLFPSTDDLLTLGAQNARWSEGWFVNVYSSGVILSGRIVTGVVPLVEQANVVTDAAKGNIFTITLNDDRTFLSPNNPINGQRITYQIKQGQVGSCVIDWSTATSGFRFSGGTAPTLTTTAGKTDYIGFSYNGIDSYWDCIAERMDF